MALSKYALASIQYLRETRPLVTRFILHLCDTGRLALMILCSTMAVAHAQTSTCANTTTTPPTYYYDAGGRLTAVLDGTGKTSNYSYDLAGNILSVIQNPSSTVQVLQVCPNQAPVGSAVTIWGTGFASGATVAFGNAAATNATVVSPNQIIATVPSGAMGIAVSVTPNGGTKVSSPTTFNVGALPPQITGISGGTTVAGYTAFNPFPFYSAASGADATGALSGSAAATQSMTISGTGFIATGPAMPLVSTTNKVWIGSQAAQITSATATSLTVNVPIGGSVIKNGALPGVTVSTPSGTATYSSQTLFITPAAVSPYLINVKSSSTSPASMNYCGVDTSEVDAVTDALAIGGSQTLSFSAGSTKCAGQTANSLHYVAYIFSGVAGSTVDAQVSVCASGATNCGPGGTSGYTSNSVLLVAPDGSEVDAADLGGSYPPPGTDATQEFYRLPKTGTYTMYVQNQSAGGGGTAQVSLSYVPAAQVLGLKSIGSSVSATVSAFQAASFGFNVPAGSSGRVTLLTTLASPSGSPFVVTVTAPDNFSRVYSNVAPPEGDLTGIVSPGQVDFSGPISVPSTGTGTTYTVSYQSLSPTSASVTFTLAQLSSDTVVSGCGSLPQSGSTTAATLACPAATISMAGQGISASFGGSSIFTNNGSSANFIGALQTSATNFPGCYEILLTDTGLQQQFYRSVQCGNGDFSYALQFPNGSVGPYVAQAFGIGQNTGTLQFTLSASSPLAAMQTRVNPSGPSTATISSAGQSQVFSFSNSSPGSSISLGTVGQSGWSQCYAVAIKSKGNTLGQAFGTYLSCPSGPSGSLGVLQLPSATNNTYAVLLTPAGGQTGTISLTASSASAAPPGTVPINGNVYDVLSSASTNYSSTYTPTGGVGSYADVVTIPSIPTTTQVIGSISCYEVTVTQSGLSQPLFDSAGQKNPYQVSKDLACSDPDVSAPPLATPLVSSSQGTVNFSLNNASQTTSGSFSQTVYNYSVNANYSALTPSAAGPAGLVLPSTFPAQPVAVFFKPGSANNFVSVYAGLDSALAANCMVLTVSDQSNGKQLATRATCEPALTLGAIAVSASDIYEVLVQPQGNAVGNVSIGVGAQ